MQGPGNLLELGMFEKIKNFDNAVEFLLLKALFLQILISNNLKLENNL